LRLKINLIFARSALLRWSTWRQASLRLRTKLMRKIRKAEKQFQTIPKPSKCAWCGGSFDYNKHDWLVDGAGEELHVRCFNERWLIMKEPNE
jgi:hypothetical protein